MHREEAWLLTSKGLPFGLLAEQKALRCWMTRCAGV
jgi:hypothetical protein